VNIQSLLLKSLMVAAGVIIYEKALRPTVVGLLPKA